MKLFLLLSLIKFANSALQKENFVFMVTRELHEW